MEIKIFKQETTVHVPEKWLRHEERDVPLYHAVAATRLLSVDHRKRLGLMIEDLGDGPAELLGLPMDPGHPSYKPYGVEHS